MTKNCMVILLQVIFILGGPGSGKGTQCGKLVAEFRLVCIYTYAKGTKCGKHDAIPQ